MVTYIVSMNFKCPSAISVRRRGYKSTAVYAHYRGWYPRPTASTASQICVIFRHLSGLGAVVFFESTDLSDVEPRVVASECFNNIIIILWGCRALRNDGLVLMVLLIANVSRGLPIYERGKLVIKTSNKITFVLCSPAYLMPISLYDRYLGFIIIH